jgi:hypothetical protein
LRVGPTYTQAQCLGADADEQRVAVVDFEDHFSNRVCQVAAGCVLRDLKLQQVVFFRHRK